MMQRTEEDYYPPRYHYYNYYHSFIVAIMYEAVGFLCVMLRASVIEHQIRKKKLNLQSISREVHSEIPCLIVFII